MTSFSHSSRSALRLFAINRLALVGLCGLVIITGLAVLAPVLPLPDPNLTDQPHRLLRPFASDHLLGTDHLGRDLLSRLLWGTRLSLLVAVGATAVAVIAGSVLGLVAGYFGGRVDSVLMRVLDMLMAFPYVLLAIAIMAALGPGLLHAVYAIALVNIPYFARTTRGAALTVMTRDFIAAAKLSGRSHAGVVFAELLPNVLPAIVVACASTVGWVVLETAGLSFLGLGAQPPVADLGSMIGQARAQVFTAPHTSLIPGTLVFLIVLCVNFLGDGVRDLLDPRLRSGVMSRPAPVTKVEPPMAPNHQNVQQTGLRLTALNVAFGEAPSQFMAVRNVSFELSRGDCVGIVGESGSGKSVTALSIARLVASPPGRIIGGQVTFDGVDILSLAPRQVIEMRGAYIAYVFQDPLTSLHPLLPVAEQIAEAITSHQLVTHSEAYRQAVALMEQVEIPDAARRAGNYPHQFSGGQRQRIGIAIALANNPDIVIADEPTTALDASVQRRVLMLLRAQQEERGLGLLLITHDFGVVAGMCDRVVVMKDGEIVEQGKTSDVLARPSHPYTRKLLACVPRQGEGEGFLTRLRGLIST